MSKKEANTMEKTKLQPLGNRVLVKRLAAEETLKGGIILPDSAKKKQEQATVIAVGPGKTNAEGKLIPISIKPGSIVLIEKYSGQEVSLNDEDFVIVKADDIIAIIEN